MAIVLFKNADCLPAPVIQSEAQEGFAFFISPVIKFVIHQGSIFITAGKKEMKWQPGLELPIL